MTDPLQIITELDVRADAMEEWEQGDHARPKTSQMLRAAAEALRRALGAIRVNYGDNARYITEPLTKLSDEDR